MCDNHSEEIYDIDERGLTRSNCSGQRDRYYWRQFRFCKSSFSILIDILGFLSEPIILAGKYLSVTHRIPFKRLEAARPTPMIPMLM